MAYSASQHIWGRRFSPTGVVVDASPFAINNNSGSQYPGGGGDQRDDDAGGVVRLSQRATAPDIYGTRVTGNTVLDGVGTGIAISTAANTQSNVSITFGAGNWLVTWQDFRNGNNDIYGARVAGTTASRPRQRRHRDLHEPGPSVRDVGGFERNRLLRRVVRRSQQCDHRLRRVRRTRQRRRGGDRPRGVSRSATTRATRSYPSVAFGGSNYQVVWQDARGFGLYGNRVAPGTGALVDGPAGIADRSLDDKRLCLLSAPRPDGNVFLRELEPVHPPDSDGYVAGSRLTAPTPPALPVLQDAPGIASDAIHERAARLRRRRR